LLLVGITLFRTFYRPIAGTGVISWVTDAPD